MVNVIKKNISNKTIIKDVEKRFFLVYSKGNCFDDDCYLKVLKKIDDIETKDGDVVTTKFGKTTLDNVSTGCKALLLIIYYLKENNYDVVVSVDECGENVIDLIFELGTKYDINIYTSSYFTTSKIDVKCCIDGKAVSGGYNIYKTLINN